MTVLMISVATFKARMIIHDNVDEKLIYPEIAAAQDLFILPIVGTALYNKLIADIQANNLTGDYKTLVDDYLTNTLCNYIMSEMPIALTYQFWNKGVSIKTSDNVQQPTMSEMYTLVGRYKDRAENYQRRAILYLKQNAANKFPEYINPGSGIDTVIPDRVAYTSPIYLGDECHHYKSYEEKYQGNIPRCDC